MSLQSPLFFWFAFALICLGLEVLQGMPFVLLFFALAGFFTACSVACGLTPLFWQQAVLAATLSLTSLLAGRSALLAWAKRSGVGKPGALGTPHGALGLVLDAAEPGARVRVELFGVPWTGRNVGVEAIAKGARCQVVGVDGLRLDVIGVEQKLT